MKQKEVHQDDARQGSATCQNIQRKNHAFLTRQGIPSKWRERLTRKHAARLIAYTGPLSADGWRRKLEAAMREPIADGCWALLPPRQVYAYHRLSPIVWEHEDTLELATVPRWTGARPNDRIRLTPKGAGAVVWTWCPGCEGRGRLGLEDDEEGCDQVTCPDCAGSGRLPESRLPGAA